MSAGTSLVLWTVCGNLAAATVGALFLGSLTVAVVTAGSGILALFVLREILAKD